MMSTGLHLSVESSRTQEQPGRKERKKDAQASGPKTC
uniref:Uncharacterized protein n=1 Tax=Anguilla anguilla TaxID=7936 RepID=A0A0E9RG61_ANGAN